MEEVIRAIALFVAGAFTIRCCEFAWLWIFRRHELRQAAKRNSHGIAVDLRTNRWVEIYNGRRVRRKPEGTND